MNTLNCIIKMFFEDYRKINKKYSNVVSIEMFEAVGKKYWIYIFKN